MEFENLVCDLDIRDASSTLTCQVQQPVQIQEEFVTQDEFATLIILGAIGAFFIFLFTLGVLATTSTPPRRKGSIIR
jgi:hypothetical protein